MQVVDVNGNMFGYDHLEIIGPDGRPKNIISTTYVPYTGAITDVDLGAHSLKADYLEVDQNTVHVVSTAQIGWNETDGTFDMGMLNGVTLQAGQELYFYAKATEAITNGQAIQFAGAQGSHLLIKRAIPSEINANPEYFVGVATQDFATNDFGYVTSFGKVRDLNTLAYPEGTILYFASGGSTPGALTATEPSAPNAKILVAAVVRSHGTQGTLLVRPHVMPKIEKLQDVNVTGATSGQVLTYNGSIWVPTTPTTGTVTSVTASAPLSSSGGTTPNITISQASGTDDGYLSSTDWLTFNNKQPAGNYITSLSGEATGSGPGTASVTLNNASVTAKVLTGVNITGGSISASDSILTAFGKLQNQINGLIGSSVYQGTWNASTNTPALASGVGTRGYYYIVNVAGSTNLDGITDWNVGDWAIFDGTAWQQVDNTDSVTSVNGQTGAVSLTTDNIPEGATNLYFTQPRARQSISLTTSGSSGAATYNNGTGVFNIPNYTLSGLGGVPTSRRLEINGISYDLSADRSWSVGTVTSIATSGPITGGTITGSGTIGINQASATDDGYLSSTDWNTFNNKQNAITLTTTGTSGPATLIGSTLNIPQYQSVITNPVTGTGTANYVARWTSSSNISTGVLYDNGTNVGIGTSSPSYKLDVHTGLAGDSIRLNNTNLSVGASNYYGFIIAENGTNLVTLRYRRDGTGIAELYNLNNAPFVFGTNNLERLRITANGTVLVGITTAGANGLLQVNGGIGLAQNTDVRQSTNSDGGTLRFLGTQFVAGITNSQSYNYSGGALMASVASSDNAVLLDVGRATSTDARFKISNTTSGNATLSFGTSTVSTLYAVTNGNVGIGTSSPGAKLHVSGTTETIIKVSDTGGAYLDILQQATNSYLIASNALIFYNGGSERARITSTGNVGIGTTNPSGHMLDVASTAGNVGNSAIRALFPVGGGLLNTEFGALAYRNGVWTAVYGKQGAASSAAYFDGNVGIGTATPSQKLNVVGNISISYTNSLIIQDAAGASGFTLTNSSAGVVMRQANNGLLKFWAGFSSSASNIISFAVGNNTEIARFTNDGNLGIGTTSPNTPFDIQTNSSAYAINIRNRSSNDYSNITFSQYDGTTYNASLGWAISRFRITTGGLGDAYERFTITSTGNVGIGTTSPLYKLQLYSSDTSQPSLVGVNVYPTVGMTLGHGYNFGGFMSPNNITSKIQFRPSGSPGYFSDDIVFYTTAPQLVPSDSDASSEVMRVTSSGSVGIGTSITDRSAILDVVSRSKGFLPPRMSYTDMVSIPAPAAGLVVYDVTNNKLTVYTGSGWVPLH